MSDTQTIPEVIELLEDIRQFCTENNLPKTTFGKLAVNDACLVTDLEKGRDPRVSLVARIRNFMSGSAQ